MVKENNDKQTKIIKTKVKNAELVEQKHLQIVKAASKLFSEKGYNKTSLRDISEESGINLSYIYKYISKKDDILFLFYRYITRKIDGLIQKAGKKEFKNPVDELRFALTVLYNGLNEMNEEALTMYTESRHLENDSLMAVLTEESKFVASIEKLIQRGVTEGYFQTRDSFVTSNIIAYLLAFYPLRSWNFQGRYSYEHYVDLMIHFIFDALQVKPEYR